MLYYSNEARISHIRRINKLIEVVDNIPADILGGYENVSDIHKYLVQYREAIQKELRRKVTVNKSEIYQSKSK